MRNPSSLFVAAFAALALALPPAAQAVTYTWNVAGTGSYIVSTNWTPTRTTPAADDVLLFNNGAANIVTNVFGGTIAQLLVQPGTSVDLRANGSGHTITIAGGSGTDLDVPTGAVLSISTSNSLALNLGASATGVIGGTVTLGGAAHRVRANSVDGLIVQGSGQVRAITGFSGNPFGTGTDGLSVFNSVRFQAGSVFLQEAGSHPFGAIAPNSVVVFDHGSRFVNRNAVTLQFSGRTYGDLEYDSPGTTTALGSQAWTVDSLILTQGAIAIGMTGAVHIKGSIRLQPGTNLQFGTGSGGTAYLDGTAPQSISDPSFGDGIVQMPGHSLVIDNPAGIDCSNRIRLRSNLHFLQGVFRLGDLEWVDIDSTGTITNASQATGWVAYSVQMSFSPSRPLREFPIGTETSYSPMTVQFGNVTGEMMVQGAVTPETYEQADAELDSTKSLNLIYLVLPRLQSDTLDWNGMVVTFRYQDADLDPAADSTALVTRVKSFNIGPGADPWRSTTPFGSFQPNQVQALVPKYRTGDALHTFLIGEQAVLTLATSSGNSSPEGGAVPEARASGVGSMLGANVASFDIHLSQVAIDTVRVDYATADSTATVANNDYVPVSGTLVFLPGEILKTVNVTLVGDGTPERDEIVLLRLSNASHATLLTPSSFFVIADDDDHSAPTVQVVGPNGGEVRSVGASTNLTWSASDNVAVDFVSLWISRNSGGTWTKISGNAPNTGSYSWTVTGPPTNQARLRVIAFDDPGNSAQDESDADWTITATTDVEPIASTTFELALPMPSPARTKTRLAYALPRASHVRLTVHDIAGRVVATLVDQELPAGRHVASWNAMRHAAGLYLVRMQAGEFSATRRIVITP